MTGAEATSPRERYRIQMRAAIKEQAWEQIAAAGASALSLNAIAKSLGMTGPALFRYFANRDELITELIRDAYRSLADTVRAAADSGAGISGLAHTVRDWALSDPQRYFLIYGTPVPGYRAPAETTVLSDEILTVLLEAHSDLPPSPTGHPATTLDRALIFWTRVHGVLSLELAGHFDGMGFDPAQLFTAEVDRLTSPTG